MARQGSKNNSSPSQEVHRVSVTPTISPITVVIIDDNSAYRTSVVACLNANEQFQCIGSFATADSAVQALQTHIPNIILMDIHLSEESSMSGIECTEHIVRQGYATAIIMLSSDNHERTIIDAFVAGAQGFIYKSGTPEEIYQAIRTVHEGESYISPQIAHKVIKQLQSMFAPTHLYVHSRDLSERELSILQAMAKGYTYKQVASLLFISPATVRTHLSNIYAKLGVSSKQEALAKMFKL
jgi:two-component system, NarL family, response regulator LiaR